MTDRVQGRCWACNSAGPEGRTRNFLCGMCAHPEQIRSFCSACGVRRSYDPEGLAKLCATYGITQTIGPGTVLRLECCSVCTPKPTRQKIEFYSVAA
ncbi:MAG TPA: hypothetical protein VL283_05300 [Candidatus Baltobacteraceae bacterium]|nr:hypothetical protein [Candidatus Baltobacteraceae bacterium]